MAKVTDPDTLVRDTDVSFDTGTNIVDVYINYLRKKIDEGQVQADRAPAQ